MAAVVRLWAPIDMRVTGVAPGLGFVALNLAGVDEAARVQLDLVGGLMLLMLLYVAWDLPEVDIRPYAPFAPQDMAAVFSTAGLVFVSYGGLMKIAGITEDVFGMVA